MNRCGDTCGSTEEEEGSDDMAFRLGESGSTFQDMNLGHCSIIPMDEAAGAAKKHGMHWEAVQHGNAMLICLRRLLKLSSVHDGHLDLPRGRFYLDWLKYRNIPVKACSATMFKDTRCWQYGTKTPCTRSSFMQGIC